MPFLVVFTLIFKTGMILEQIKRRRELPRASIGTRRVDGPRKNSHSSEGKLCQRHFPSFCFTLEHKAHPAPWHSITQHHAAGQEHPPELASPKTSGRAMACPEPHGVPSFTFLSPASRCCIHGERKPPVRGAHHSSQPGRGVPVTHTIASKTYE